MSATASFERPRNSARTVPATMRTARSGSLSSAKSPARLGATHLQLFSGAAQPLYWLATYAADLLRPMDQT